MPTAILKLNKFDQHNSHHMQYKKAMMPDDYDVDGGQDSDNDPFDSPKKRSLSNND